MFNIFKSRKSTKLFTVTYKFEGEEMTYITTATSAGLASLEADWYIDILDVRKL